MEQTRPHSPVERKEPILSSPVLAMIVFIFTEIMIFASFISAFTIIKSGFTNWPPMGQPRLPVATTALNSVFLIASGFLLYWAYKAFLKESVSGKVKKLFFAALATGLLFVSLQGIEWFRLVQFGLTMTSSIYGSFFYLIIGTHAAHVLAAAIGLGFMFRRLLQGRLKKEPFAAILAFWFFVVGLWPLLYFLVYL